MNGFTFSPALGWVAGGLLAAGLAVLAILESHCLFVAVLPVTRPCGLAYDVRLCCSSSR